MGVKNTMFFLSCAFWLFYSCRNDFDGKIEKRQNDRIYLVNSSKSKILRFTIKESSIINDTGYYYNTRIITLSPGDEEYLGLENEISMDYEHLPIFRKVFKTRKDPLNLLTNLKDTIINGEKLKYEYANEPIPDTIKSKYEITGQIEMLPKNVNKNSN
jgi:hypothetical protein